MATTFIRIHDENDDGWDLCLYEDLLVPTFFFKSDPRTKLETIYRIDNRDGDVLQCSYPKTGTHWACNLVNCMLRTGPVENMPSVWPNLLELVPDVLETVSTLPSPRILSSHLKIDRQPREHIQKSGKIVFVVRNPKDTAVSMYHHSSKSPELNNKLSWSSFVTAFLNGHVAFGSYFEYLRAWQAFIEDNKDLNILVVYYEDLKKNCLSELRRINDYLGTDNNDDRLREIMKRCSLQTLKADVDDGKTKSPLVNKEGKSILYRKGEIGDWRNQFTVAQNELFDKVSKEQLRNSMFRFQYE